MRIGVIVFPDSQHHEDLLHVLQDVIMTEAIPVWHEDSIPSSVKLLMIADCPLDNKSYWAEGMNNELPIAAKLMDYVQKGGYILGISEGFGLLCSIGLLPGCIEQNESKKFVCRNVFILPVSKQVLLTSSLQRDRALRIPIAHSHGRYIADARTLASMRVNGQILFRYCEEKGEISQLANPNGSVENIAGVCNEAQNVLGLMPHPERAVRNELSSDGLRILKAIVGVVIET